MKFAKHIFSLLLAGAVFLSVEATVTLVVFREQFDIPYWTSLNPHLEPGSDAYAKELMKELMRFQNITQQPVHDVLNENGFIFRYYWISNLIAIDGDLTRRLDTEEDSKDWKTDLKNRFGDTILRISEDVENVGLEVKDKIDIVGSGRRALTKGKKKTLNSEPLETQIEWIGAHHVWANFSNYGEGRVVGTIDSGLIHIHPALVNAYRGTKRDANGDVYFDHNHNWLDATDPSIVEPTDTLSTNYHGTHVAGLAVGGYDKNIGIAPEAKLIVCRAFGGSFRFSLESLTKCLQFMFAPHDLNGENADVTLRPDVLNNSWECPGCGIEILLPAIRSLVAAGVSFVASAQNSGFNCGTVKNPPGNLPEVISIGALQSKNDFIAFFSSRGPVPDYSNASVTHIKPDLVAPGSILTSAFSSDKYSNLTGTSMSSPVAAGAYLLLSNICPELFERKPGPLWDILMATALGQKEDQCTGDEDVSPNNAYGHGTINVAKAADHVKMLCDKHGKKGKKKNKQN